MSEQPHPQPNPELVEVFLQEASEHLQLDRKSVV